MNLAERIVDILSVKGCSYITRIKQRRPSHPPGFVVKHYAGNVQYCTEDMLQKNKVFYTCHHHCIADSRVWDSLYFMSFSTRLHFGIFSIFGRRYSPNVYKIGIHQSPH